MQLFGSCLPCRRRYRRTGYDHHYGRERELEQGRYVDTLSEVGFPYT